MNYWATVTNIYLTRILEEIGYQVSYGGHNQSVGEGGSHTGLDWAKSSASNFTYTVGSCISFFLDCLEPLMREQLALSSKWHHTQRKQEHLR